MVSQDIAINRAVQTRRLPVAERSNWRHGFRGERIGKAWRRRSGCVFPFVEGRIRDPLEEFGVVAEGADVAPVDLVRGVPEVVGAGGREARQHGVDLGLAGDESGEGGILGLGHGGLRSWCPHDGVEPPPKQVQSADTTLTWRLSVPPGCGPRSNAPRREHHGNIGRFPCRIGVARNRRHRP